MKNSEILGTEKMGRLILRMTLPAILSQVVNMLYNLVDKVFIGHIPEVGDMALTGVGVTTSVILIVAAFAQFVGGGAAPLAAIAMGRGEKERASRILGNGFFLLCLMALGLTVVLSAAKTPLLYFVGASDNTIGFATDYLSIYLLGTLSVMFTIGLAPFVIAQGKTGVAMAAVLTGALLNLALDPLLIYVCDLGVKGAAIATVLSQTLSAAILLFHLIKRAELRLRLPQMKPNLAILGAIFALGVSPFVMAITESVIAIVMNNGLQKYGGDTAVGCLTIMTSVMQTLSVPLTGYTQGATPIISYNFGAGNRKRVMQAFKITLVVLFGYTTIFAALTMIFPGAFASLFTDSESILSLARQALPLFMAGMLVFGIQRACQTTFLALGQAKISLFIALLRKVFLLVPLALLLPLTGLGIWGIYAAEPIADVIAALTCGILFFFRFRKLLSAMPQKDNSPLA